MNSHENIKGFACFAERLDIAVSPFSEKHDILILESDPEPGYFSRNGFPENLVYTNDHHLYILLKHPVICFQDWLIEQALIAKNKYGFKFSIAPGQITFQNKPHNCIRIRTQEIESIKPFINILKKKKVEFLNHINTKPFESIVYFKKYIETRYLDKGIYSDLNDKNRHFIELPDIIEFEDFEKIVEQIKYNCNFNMFNTAQVTLACRDTVLNFAAIYSHDCDEARLPEFKLHIDKLFKQNYQK